VDLPFPQGKWMIRIFSQAIMLEGTGKGDGEKHENYPEHWPRTKEYPETPSAKFSDCE